MRTQVRVGLGTLVLLGSLLLMPTGDAARADEKGGAGVWVFEVRVVRIDPATKEGAEAPCPLTGTQGATTKLSWREALGLLKQRGTTTLLMDQNITTLNDEQARGHAERTVPILAVNFKNKSDEQKRATNVKTGCRLDLIPRATSLQYGLHVQWALEGRTSEDAPEQFVAEWNGSHPRLEGDTLVLRYREQVARTKGAARAVEIYGLITGRFVSGR